MELTVDLPEIPPRNYYSDDYLETDVSRGVTRNRSGTRLIALSRDFLLGLRNALTQECGDAAPVVMKTCGQRWGRVFAQRMDEELSTYYGQSLAEFSVAQFEACLVEAFSRHGWGRITLDYSHFERGLICVELDQAVYADLLGKSDRPADPLMAGFLAGLFSQLTGEDLDGVQTRCAARDGAPGRFVLGLRGRIEAAQEAVDQGKPHEQIVTDLCRIPGA